MLRTGTAAVGVAVVALVLGGASMVQAQGVSPDVLSKAREAVYGQDVVPKSEEGTPTPSAKEGPLAKVGMNLAVLHYEYEEFKREGTSDSFSPRNAAIEVREDRVIIDAIPSGSPDRLKADLERIGATRVAAAGNLVSGEVGIEKIPEVAGLSSLKSAQAVGIRKNDGEALSEGVAAMQADSVLARGFDGSGVTVGVLSDSYDGTPSPPDASDGIASGDLPPARKIKVLDDLGLGSDEGRAMMELIHDVAPGASMAFHTAFRGRASFAQGIRELREAGSDVIVDDIIYFAEPMFQEGPVAQAASDVKQQGTSYFSSAGNAADQSYESEFRLQGSSHDFDPSDNVDTTQTVRVPVGSSFTLSFQWADPYASAGNGGADGDLDVQILSKEGDVLLEAGGDNIGADPVEFTGIQNPGTIDADGDGVPDETFQVRVVLADGEAPPRAKYVYFGQVDVREYDTKSSTSFGHANAAGAEAVGAAYYQRTPEFGIDPAEIESFSAKGGVPIYSFNDDGTVASKEEREKPEIVAPDGADNTFFGSFADGDTDPDFFGTSAAAPHAAGVAALMVDKNENLATQPGTDGSQLGPDSLYKFLEQTAASMNGPSDRVGNGLVRADEAIEQVSPGGPQVPPLLATNAANGWARISWEGFEDADSYTVYRTEGASFAEAADDPEVDTSVVVSGTNSTTFRDQNVDNGTPYYYRVTADVDGVESSLAAADEGVVVPSGFQVSGIEPSAGQLGSTVRIFGSGFGSDPSVEFVTIPSRDTVSGTEVEVNGNGTRVTATVPSALESNEFGQFSDLGATAVIPVVNSSVASNEVYTIAPSGRGGELISGFSVEQSFRSGATTFHLANIDEDGLKDLVRVVPSRFGPPELEVLLTTAAFGTWDENTFNGSLGPFTLARAPVTDAHVADFNKDGLPDVVAVLENGTVQWYENETTETGSFSAAKEIATSAAGGRAVHTADVNTDGDPDVIIGTDGGATQGGRVLLYENEGGGAFSGETEIASNTTVPVRSVTASDVNDDGTQDIVAIDGDEAEWYDSEDGFAATPIATGLDEGTDVRVADLDSDEVPDILAADEGSGEVQWYQNDGSGTFGNGTDVTTPDAEPLSLSTGDFDSDGDEDVFIGQADPDSVQFVWAENEGAGGSWAQPDTISTVDANTAGGVDIEAVDATEGRVTDLVGGEVELGDGVPDVLVSKSSPDFSFQDPSMKLFKNVEPVPSPPENVVAAKSDGQVAAVLEWSESESPDNDVAGYDIYRSRERFRARERFDKFTVAKKVNESLITSNTFTDTTVKRGVQYFYRAVAQDTLGYESPGASNLGQVEFEGLTVYPGDLNDDGTVDQNDVMTLSSFWNSGGPARNRVDCDFAANEAEAWSPAEATYADANGDGQINQADARCIGVNWNQSQPGSNASSALASVEETGGKLKIDRSGEENQSSKEAGDRTFWATVSVGGQQSFKGAAFEVEYPQKSLTVESVKPAESIGEGVIAMHEVDAESGRIGIGLARPEGTVTEGPVARIKLRAKGEASGPFTLQLRQGAGQNESGKTIALETGSTELSPLPTEFSVQGSAPNPARAQTTIRYALPEATNVRVTVYDILGREVKVLVNERQNPGEKELQFRTRDLASGTYFYRVKTDDHVETRKVQVVR